MLTERGLSRLVTCATGVVLVVGGLVAVWGHYQDKRDEKQAQQEEKEKEKSQTGEGGPPGEESSGDGRGPGERSAHRIVKCTPTS
jgi:hypothetical protein